MFFLTVTTIPECDLSVPSENLFMRPSDSRKDSIEAPRPFTALFREAMIIQYFLPYV